MKQGSLSINSENIFPIIKKWLYSDHDIFYRELISNACDAITKLKKLEIMGEFDAPEDNHYQVDVIVSPEEKTIKIIDNGIGMTADEVEKYITQIAFSGAEAFLEHYKDKTNDDQIIGHFGLGFYSAFMVADKVSIDTLSYENGAKAVYWECDGGTEYTMEDSDREIRGTEITLYLNEESFEFANEWRAKEVIEKYCSFMPVEIYFTNADAPTKEEEEAKEDIPDVIDAEEETFEGEETENSDSDSEKEEAKDASTEDSEAEDSSEEESEEEKKPTPINDPHPLWNKHPNECSDEEYKEFYRKVFHDYKEPLFWIHLNMDYPFNLKGILYFPKFTNQYESIEGTIKLYNNQVFIAENIKEVIPEFLLLLKGVIDCPDLPLNVSRSALQNDGFVKKISDYITKKVADKLSGMYKTEKESYEKYWDDISPFIKFGCLKDTKFNEKMKDYILFKNLEGKYLTLPEYLEAGKEKYENKVFYVTDERVQSQYIRMFKEEEMDAVMMLHAIDSAFISHLESTNQDVKFLRIDADLADNFKEEVSEEELKETEEKLSEVFKKALNNDKLNIKVEKLKNAETSSIITLSEEARRMHEMMEMYGMTGMDPSMLGMAAESMTLTLNANNNLVQYVLDNPEGEHTNMFCEQLFDLAMLANKPLEPEQMNKFITRSNQIMGLLTK
ncbi:MAG: molecular chaperone HtpG [Lachnospiraceae bacterium]|nr:molecular chaperone HtpG [Lachnospiraceae bacterium]